MGWPADQDLERIKRKSGEEMDHLKWTPKLNINVSKVNGHRLPTEKKPST